MSALEKTNYSSKYDVRLLETEIIRFEERNKIYSDGKFKNTFYCKTDNGPVLCVYWERTAAQAGDDVFLKGRFNNEGTFLCWSMLIKQRQIQTEEFETQREFNKRFPSKFYICSRCKKTSTNPYQCTNCGNQSNNFLYRGYAYTILDSGITETIFIPIELQKKEKTNENISFY